MPIDVATMVISFFYIHSVDAYCVSKCFDLQCLWFSAHGTCSPLNRPCRVSSLQITDTNTAEAFATLGSDAKSALATGDALGCAY